MSTAGPGLEAVEARLAETLREVETAPGRLGPAMAHPVRAGGKRIRPRLALAAHRAVGGDGAGIVSVAGALELVHTYSLVHDDLPSMDDDEYRRGQLTCHRVFGVGRAVLAGAALLVRAFELLARGMEEAGVPPRVAARVQREVAEAAGFTGMVGGQAADLGAEGRAIGIRELATIQRRKTGALLRTAVRAGALLGGADRRTLRLLTRYGEKVGEAFQMVDDLQDVTGEFEAAGKRAGGDRARGKATYPALLGCAATQDLARNRVEEACALLEEAAIVEGELRALAEDLTARAAVLMGEGA